MKRMFLTTALLVLLLDQASKHAVMAWMHLRQSIELPGGFLQITYIHNSGGAFGLFPGGGPLFLVTGAVVALGMLWALPRFERWGRGTTLCCAMILGGTIGNLVDRLRFGSVVDFLDLGWWPIFNVADMGISVGITFLIAQTILAPRASGPVAPGAGLPEQSPGSPWPVGEGAWEPEREPEARPNPAQQPLRGSLPAGPAEA